MSYPNSLSPWLQERLCEELTPLGPSHAKPKVRATPLCTQATTLCTRPAPLSASRLQPWIPSLQPSAFWLQIPSMPSLQPHVSRCSPCRSASTRRGWAVPSLARCRRCRPCGSPRRSTTRTGPLSSTGRPSEIAQDLLSAPPGAPVPASPCPSVSPSLSACRLLLVSRPCVMPFCGV